ncbi:MAG: hypothetical protein MI741_21720, partial [Rhodospirillales bacterium]|nr:hypothetical protein [Rhodospirillales bacterium]
TAPQLKLRTGDGWLLDFSNMHGTFQSNEDYRKSVRFTFNAGYEYIIPSDGAAPDPEAKAGEQQADSADNIPKRGSIRSEIEVRNLLDAAGKLDHENLIFVTNTTINDIPGDLITQLVGNDERVQALFGKRASVKAVGEYPGNLDVEVDSDNLKAIFPATIDENRVLSLRRDVFASLNINEQTSSKLLGTLQPALGDAVASVDGSPAELTLKGEKLTIPLNDLLDSLDSQSDSKERDKKYTAFLENTFVRIDLRMPDVRMQRKGWLRQGIYGLIDEAQKKGGLVGLALRQPAEGEDVESKTYVASITPMTIRFNKGRIVTSDDVWITSSDMALGLDGRGDLKSGEYKFTMGVYGASLLFDGDPFLRELINPEAIFDIPVEGKLGEKPKVKYGVMGAYIAGSAARIQARKHGGELGGLLGDIVIGGIGGAQKDRIRQKHDIDWDPPEAQLQQVVNNLRKFIETENDTARKRAREQRRTERQREQKEEVDRRRNRFRDDLGPQRNRRERESEPDDGQRGLDDIFRDLERQREESR